jgi:hypothetical protein
MPDEYLPPPAPPGLRDAGIALWTETVADVEFEPHNLQVLAEAWRTLDALHSLQDALDADGPIIDSPQGRKANPALPELRQGRIVLARLLAALKIPAADDGPIKTRAPRGVHGLRGSFDLPRLPPTQPTC